VDEKDNIWVIDMWRGQTASLEWVEAFIAMLRMWRPEIWAEEAGVIMKSLGPIIEKRLQEEHVYSTTRRQFSSSTDKPTRARSLQARMQMGKVLFPNPQTHPWVADLMAEMLTFPAGKHDDMVDALSLLCRLLTDMTPPHAGVVHVKTNRPARTVWR
jgi:predicted phage terminase large subunit-like protein